MLLIKFTDATDYIKASFKQISSNVVQLIGDNIPGDSTGFETYTEGGKLIGKYHDFTTVYKVVDGGLQFSNDESVWVPTVTFTVNGGGSLTGTLVWNVWDYKYITVPTPVETEDWSYNGWTPPIPGEGAISEDVTHVCNFKYIGPEPTPTPTVEERLDELESTQADQDEVLEYLLGVE